MTLFQRAPLDLSSFPDPLLRHVQADADPKRKMMAARGLLPAPPEQMLLVLYQLSFDPDPKMTHAVESSITDMPTDVLASALRQTDQPGVLDWLAEVRAEDAEISESIARHAAADDLTIVDMAQRADRRLADIIATNQVRVLRTPKIIEELYQNPQVRSATVSTLLELAQRENVKLEGLPGVQQALRSGADIFSDAPSEDSGFEALLQDEVQRAAEEERKFAQLDDENLTRSQRERLRGDLDASAEYAEEPQEDTRERPLRFQIQHMSIAEKIRLATVGSREAVKLLISDTNKLVHMAAVRSPRVKPADVKRFASNRSLPDGVIEYIANNRDWTQKYDVIKALVLNPKTPLRDTLRFLNHLRANDLRKVSRSRNVPHQVSRSAKSLLKKRQGR